MNVNEYFNRQESIVVYVPGKLKTLLVMHLYYQCKYYYSHPSQPYWTILKLCLIT